MASNESYFYEEGGIDSDRIVDDEHKVANEFLCTICQGLLWHPRACASCQHLFCRKCIGTWARTNPTSCPFRCSPYEEKRAPPHIRSLLSRLSIRCRNHSFGCDEILSYDALEQHETTQCQFPSKQCRTCGQYLLVEQIEEHQASCAPATIRCSICKHLIDRTSFDQHVAECLQKKLNLFIDQMLSTPDTADLPTNNPFAAAHPPPPPPPPPQDTANENWLTHLNNRMQRNMPRVNLVGYEAAVAARQGSSWARFSTMCQLIYNNPSQALYIVYFLLFVSIGSAWIRLIFVSPRICDEVRKSIYRSIVPIILCSGLIGFGFPFLLAWINDTSIIVITVLGLVVDIMANGDIPMEQLQLAQSQKVVLALCFIMLFGFKMTLLVIRFYWWCTSPYITAGVLAWLTIFITYQLGGLSIARR